MKKTEKKEPKTVNKKLIFNIVLWSLGGLSVLLILLWDYIFKDKPISEGGEGGFVAIGTWFKEHYDIPVYTILVIGIAILVCALLSLFKRKVKIKNKKGATIVSLALSLLKWAAIVVALFLILKRWGVDTTKILASIGIITLVIGLGCQSLISDIVAGIFLVADNAFEVGDIVVVDGFRGTVTEIGLKTTKIEDAGGNIKLINNGAITSMVNLTNALSIAVVDISIPYEENLARTETLLIKHLESMPERIPAIVEGPFYKGMEDMADSAVILKVIAKVKEEDRFQVVRDMKRDIYIFLNENNIVIPYPQVTITQGPNPADHPEWVNKEKEEKKAQKEMAKQQEESKDAEVINEIK